MVGFEGGTGGQEVLEVLLVTGTSEMSPNPVGPSRKGKGRAGDGSTVRITAIAEVPVLFTHTSAPIHLQLQVQELGCPLLAFSGIAHTWCTGMQVKQEVKNRSNQ